ncbi:MAG: T9SS C-terminal target domain-containing protein [Chryseobacterium sp.]|nr:MAG: T9SS C-terminal target domain-containing protein [Chryseobacterium sp.]
MRRKNYLFLLTLLSVWMQAQFVSPGNGTTYSLGSLATAAPSALRHTATAYEMHADITISAGDRLEITESDSLKIAQNILLTIGGELRVNVPKFVMTAINSTQPFKGIRFEEGSKADLRNTDILYGGGLRVLTGDFFMDNCLLYRHNSGISSGAAISFSRGKPVVQNSTFLENDLPAFASAANASVAATFSNNKLLYNNKSNSNRPQINMGPSGTDTLRIVNNTIIGDRSLTKVGGISASTLLGVVNRVIIDGNTIRDNRYGITVAGNNSGGHIRNNIIENNNTEGQPNIGGSGISLSGNGPEVMNIFVTKNQIRGNLWGITLVGNARANLGSDLAGQENVGQNVFAGNANGGVTYALYNNTPNPVEARFNCWREGETSTAEMVEEVIFHKNDDAALGLVNYTPFNCAGPLSTVEATAKRPQVYPNPNKGSFVVTAKESGKAVVLDANGRSLHRFNLKAGENRVQLRLLPGMYILRTVTGTAVNTTKLIID